MDNGNFIDPILYDSPSDKPSQQDTEGSPPMGNEKLINPIAIEPISYELVDPIVYDAPSADESPSQSESDQLDEETHDTCPEEKCNFQEVRSASPDFVQPPAMQDEALKGSILGDSPSAIMQSFITLIKSEVFREETSKSEPVPPVQGPATIMSDEKPRPYDLAEKVKKIYTLRVFCNELYIFTGKYYQHLPSDDAYTLIRSACEAEVAAIGNERIVMSAYSLLLMDAELKVNQKRPETEYTVFENGLLRLVDGVFLKHDPAFFITTEVRAKYIPDKIHCPKFDAFLHELCCGDLKLEQRVLQMIGYCLVSDTGARVFFVLQGPSGSGKSTILDLITLFFGAENITSMDFTDMMHDPHCTSDLIGRPLCTFPDLADRTLDPDVVSDLKKLTGGDLMTANPKHKKRVRFYNSAKLVAATNGKILLQRPDDALHRRIVAIPCHHPIPHDAMQAYFVKQLADEMDSIASKAVLAYFQLRENHYQFAGDYRINEPWENGDSQKDEVEVIATEDCIKKYLVENYQPDSKGRVFIEDAYKEFTGVYSEMLLQKFSHLFVEEAEKIFNSKKDRKRREGASNAQACVLGISHI